MTNRHLRRALLEKLDITRQALSLRAKRLKQEKPMTTTDAIYIIAYYNGIPLERYLAPELIERVKALLAAAPSPAPKEAPRPDSRREGSGR